MYTLLLIAMQLAAPQQIRFTWDQPTEAYAFFNLYRAPLVTTTATNGDGIPIDTQACGVWRKMGNSNVLAGQNSPGPGAWCFAVSTVHVEQGIDLLTNTPLTIQSESDRSDPVIVFIADPAAPIAPNSQN